MAAGDLNGEALVASLNQHLQGWPEPLRLESDSASTDLSESAPIAGAEGLDLPGASQSSIRVLLPGPGWSAGSLSAELLAEGLGGSFTAPLSRILREKKATPTGPTRYVEREEGLMVLSMVFRDVTAAALQDLHQLLDEAPGPAPCC